MRPVNSRRFGKQWRQLSEGWRARRSCADHIQPVFALARFAGQSPPLRGVGLGRRAEASGKRPAFAHWAPARQPSSLARAKAGAGEGNRTLVISLEGCCSTIELHPQTADRIKLWLAKPKLADTSPTSPDGLRRGSLRRWRERRLVGEVGLEPTKAKPADLQSAPFAARDTPPKPRFFAAFRPRRADIGHKAWGVK